MFGDEDFPGIGYKYQCNYTDDGGVERSVCVPLAQYCDGHNDCPGGVDEQSDCGEYDFMYIMWIPNVIPCNITDMGVNSKPQFVPTSYLLQAKSAA